MCYQLINLFFQISVYNSSCLYRKEESNKKVTDLAFREALVNEILNFTGPHKGTLTQRLVPSTQLGERPPRLVQRHFLSTIPPTANAAAKGKKHGVRVCHLCPKATDGSRKRSETSYWCVDCNVALCVDPCFKIYHTRLNLNQ